MVLGAETIFDLGPRLAPDTNRPEQGIPRSLGLLTQTDPVWATSLLTIESVEWIGQRWHSHSREFRWIRGDCLAKSLETRDPGSIVLDLSDVHDEAVMEILTGIACDARDGFKTDPSPIRRILQRLRRSGSSSILELRESGLTTHARRRLRHWSALIEVASADRETEWLRDEVRLAVVKSGYGGKKTLPMGRIQQPWLRDMAVEVCRIRTARLGGYTAWNDVVACGQLSTFLATRSDAGSNPSALTSKVMADFALYLETDGDMSPSRHLNTLRSISAVLTEAAALGFTDKHGLPKSFAVRKQHHPRIPTKARSERAFPDATFRMLMGVDEHLGSGVWDLARSIPQDHFRGEVFVQAISLMASFGRRRRELCELRADRLRQDGSGSASIRYDNFKSGRNGVWLPIDSRQAAGLNEWISLLRQRYPSTTLQQLAILPAAQLNPHGTRALMGDVLTDWFLRLVRLLDQAIVIAHLHAATKADLHDLCSSKVADFDNGSLALAAGATVLSTPAQEMLIDYRHDLVNRHRSTKHVPPIEELPLFPDPTANPGRGGYRPVKPEQLAPLGNDWLERAAQYNSPGIPGSNLGSNRVNPDDLKLQLFRHTYLQHLVNLGTDIFVVQELADHTNVQTTINSYVRAQDDKLREAVEELSKYRIDSQGQRRPSAIPLLSRGTGIRSANCDNPQVLDLGIEGCEYDGLCPGCNHYSGDPSFIPDIKAEIQTCVRTIVRLEAEDDEELRPHQIKVLRARRTMWQQALSKLNTLLEGLPASERNRVLSAATIVREFRHRARNGGTAYGNQPLPSSEPDHPYAFGTRAAHTIKGETNGQD